MPLSAPDKVPAPHGYGCYYNHTEPQRRVDCILGSLLVPVSADSIESIDPGRLESVQRALNLYADLLDDVDHAIFLGMNPKGIGRGGVPCARYTEAANEAAAVRRAARALGQVMRVERDPMVGLGG